MISPELSDESWLRVASAAGLHSDWFDLSGHHAHSEWVVNLRGRSTWYIAV